MFKIPSDKKSFSQPNESDRTGNIYQSKNVTFDKKGYISLEKRTRVVADSGTYTDLVDGTSPLIAMAYKTGIFMIIANKNIYGTTDTDFPVFTKNVTASVPTLDSGGNNDMLYWDAPARFVIVNASTDIFKWSGSAWSTTSTYGGRRLCIFENRQELAIATTNVVYTVNTSFALVNTLTLPATYNVTSMAWNKNRLGIATRNVRGGDTIFFEWDGSTNEANRSYPIVGHTVYSTIAYKDGFACITSKGELIYLNGSAVKLSQLPVTPTDNVWGNNSAVRVYHRGMQVENDLIYVAVNGLYTNVMDVNRKNREQAFPSGVWCYDPAVGMYPRWTIDGGVVSKTDAITTGNVNTTTDVITVAGATVPTSGTPCFYYSPTVIGGLKDGLRYFVINVSSTTLKLATTYENAIAGTAIDLTSTGNNAQYIRFMDNSGFGGIQNTPSCLMKFPTQFLTLQPQILATKLLIGGQVQRGTATSQTIATLSAVESFQENRGYVVTPLLEAEGKTDTFQDINIKYKKLINSDDKIIVKYRKVDNQLKDFTTPNDTSGTWTDSDTFTTTNDMTGVATGDEIEIVAGSGAGYLVHVSSISENAGTYTINIDESIQNISASDRLVFYVSNWKKLGEITTTDPFLNKTFRVQGATTWVQFKVELRGVGVTIEEVSVSNVAATR